MARQAPGITGERLELYEKLVARLPDVERKGAAMPYTSWNGNMFSFLDKEGKLRRMSTTLCLLQISIPTENGFSNK